MFSKRFLRTGARACGDGGRNPPGPNELAQVAGETSKDEDMLIRKAAVAAALAAALATTACAGMRQASIWDQDMGTSSAASGGPNDPGVQAQRVGDTASR